MLHLPTKGRKVRIVSILGETEALFVVTDGNMGCTFALNREELQHLDKMVGLAKRALLTGDDEPARMHSAEIDNYLP